jgi:hypothetical protein
MMEMRRCCRMATPADCQVRKSLMERIEAKAGRIHPA